MRTIHNAASTEQILREKIEVQSNKCDYGDFFVRPMHGLN